MSIQPLWLNHFIEILLVLEFQLTKFIVGAFSYKAHFRPQISSNVLKSVNNAVSRAVDFWTMRSLEAFLTEFTIDTDYSFSKAERQFFKGPRGKYLNSLSLRIKMLLEEKRILLIESDC